MSLREGERVRTTRELRFVLPDAPVPGHRADMPWTGEVVRQAAAGERGEERRWVVRFDDIEGEYEVDETLLTPMDVPPL